MGPWCVRGDVAPGGRDHLERVGDLFGTRGLIVDPVLRISGVAGGRKEMSRGSENPTKRKRVGGTREKGNEARAAWSICAKTTLCAYARASLRRRPGMFIF